MENKFVASILETRSSKYIHYLPHPINLLAFALFALKCAVIAATLPGVLTLRSCSEALNGMMRSSSKLNGTAPAGMYKHHTKRVPVFNVRTR